MSTLTCVTGRKLPRSTRIDFLYSTSEGCSTSPVAENIAALLRPNCTSRRLITRLSTCRKAMPENSIMSISMRRVLKLSSSDSISLFGLVVETERAVEQVDADDAQGFLLQGVFGVEHPHVQDDLAVLVARMGLKSHAHPAVALVGALEVARRNRVGKGEERGRVAAAFAQSVQVQLVLVVEHRLRAAAGRRTARIRHRWRR